MVKKKVRVTTEGATKSLPSMEDEFEVPEIVQLAATGYKKANAAKAKATSKFTESRDSLIEAMREKNVERVRIEMTNGVEKWLWIEELLKIKQETVKKQVVEPDD